jgi:hypothetical protein
MRNRWAANCQSAFVPLLTASQEEPIPAVEQNIAKAPVTLRETLDGRLYSTSARVGTFGDHPELGASGIDVPPVRRRKSGLARAGRHGERGRRLLRRMAVSYRASALPILPGAKQKALTKK